MGEPSAPPLRLALAPGITLERGGGGNLRVRAENVDVLLERAPDAIASTVALLAGDGLTEEAASEHAERAGGFAAVVRLQLALQKLARGGALHHVVRGPEEELARLEATTPFFQLAAREPESDRLLRLSRFAYLRRDGDRMALESPRAHARVTLRGPALPLLATLAAPRSIEALDGTLAPALLPAARALVALLARAGLVVEADAQGATEEERHPSVAPWEFHDLLFHVRSRRQHHGQHIGATWRFAETIPPLPAVAPPRGEPIELPRPDLQQLARTDPPLVEVMERRRSIRTSGARPLTLAQLGELLYRCARVRNVFRGERDELSSRPYPSGGARYPLEVYLAVSACKGLLQGLYHYEPAGHRLEQRSPMTPAVQALLAGPRLGGPQEPQVLVILAARFGRASWKYESITYCNLLKEAGVLLQSMYLAATASGLAACAVGHGDPDVFERATGTDGYAESSIAELVLGSLPEGV